MKKKEEQHEPLTCRGFYCEKCKEFLATATPDQKIDYLFSRVARLESAVGRLTWRA